MKLHNRIDETGDTNLYNADCSLPIRQRSILAVDDKEDILHIFSHVLMRDGFRVNTACDGQQAWEMLLQDHYDMLITDNEMPRLTGIKLIKRIRNAEMHLPTIIATGHISMEIMMNYTQLQIAAVLKKPFTIFELSNIVKQVLNESYENIGIDEKGSHKIHTVLQPIL